MVHGPIFVENPDGSITEAKFRSTAWYWGFGRIQSWIQSWNVMKCLACLRQSDCVSIERAVNILMLMMLQVLLALSILDFGFSMFGFEDRLIIWSMPFLLLVSQSLFFGAGLSCKHPNRHILWNISIPNIFNTCQYTRANNASAITFCGGCSVWCKAVKAATHWALRSHSRPRDPQQTHCSADFRWRVKNIEKSDPDEAAEQRQNYTNMFIKFVKYFQKSISSTAG